MERVNLAAARYSKGWSQEDAAERIGVTRATLSQWERGMSNPYPIHIHRLCEIYGKTAAELGLEQKVQGLTETVRAEIENILLHSTAIEKFLPQCSVSIAACGTLSDNGKRQDMVLASQVITTFLPILRTIIQDSSTYRKTAASLVSQILQMKQRLAYHLEGIQSALSYAEGAVSYARESEDTTRLAMALRELASVYEWPMDHIAPHQRRKRSLELTEEAAYLPNVIPLVQSWVYIGLAKFQALNALKQDAYTSIGKAQEAFVVSPQETMPGFHLDEANLIRQESIVYAYLGQQDRALQNFLSLVDINNEHVAAKLPMPARTRLGLLSEATFSSLKLPQAKKDRALSRHLWLAELQQAQDLHSETYLSEASIAYRIMEAVWSDDAEILDLRDLINH